MLKGPEGTVKGTKNDPKYFSNSKMCHHFVYQFLRLFLAYKHSIDSIAKECKEVGMKPLVAIQYLCSMGHIFSSYWQITQVECFSIFKIRKEEGRLTVVLQSQRICMYVYNHE